MPRPHHLILTLLFLVPSTARAVIVLGPQGRNTTQPTAKALRNSGWQYQGDFRAFSGTPIAPNFFITAQHIGFSPGDSFTFDGVTYSSIAAFSDSGTDLRIIQVDGTFPTFAPLFTGKNERGRQVMLIGRGTQRGDPVLVKKHRRGWLWGEEDEIRSWGLNTVRNVGTFGGPNGDLLRIAFSPGAGPNEGTISAGDSGGGMFIKDKGVWKLAGINFSAVSNFSYTGVDGSGFSASLYNEAGLYTGADGNWTLQRQSVPVSAFASRISSNIDWINSVLDGTAAPDLGSTTSSGFSSVVPEPGCGVMIGMCVIALLRRRTSLRFSPSL